MREEPRPDVYFSADVETDGPIPGEFSLLSFALSVAGRFDGRRYTREGRESDVFYAELRPISQRFESEALEVNGLDRDRLADSGTHPAHAMRNAAEWIRERSIGARAVLVAYPVAFDWTFLYWYFIRFNADSPFGFASCLDIRTLYQARALSVHDRAGKRFMPAWLRPNREHTHHAVDDALEQGELFSNLFEWALAGGGAEVCDADPDWQPSPPEWLTPLTSPLVAKSRQRTTSSLIRHLVPKANSNRVP